MKKYELAKSFATSISVTLGIVIFFASVALTVPCGAGQGKCGPSTLFFIIPCVLIIVWVQSWISSFKKDIDERGEEVVKEWKAIVPVLIVMQIIIAVPIFWFLI